MSYLRPIIRRTRALQRPRTTPVFKWHRTPPSIRPCLPLVRISSTWSRRQLIREHLPGILRLPDRSAWRPRIAYGSRDGLPVAHADATTGIVVQPANVRSAQGPARRKRRARRGFVEFSVWQSGLPGDDPFKHNAGYGNYTPDFPRVVFGNAT